MAFVDDFSGESSDVDLASHTPSGGTSWTRSGTSGGIIVNAAGECRPNDTNTSYYVCDDQGSANQYTEHQLASTQASQDAAVACRLVDADNFVGWRLYGTGGAGARLIKKVSGTITDLVNGAFGSTSVYRIECNGTDVDYYKDSVQVGTTTTVTDHATETSQGLVNDANNATAWITSFEAGALGGGPVTLAVSDVTQSQTLDNVTLTQAHSLTPNALDQSQTLDNVTLTQANVLSIQDAAQSQTLDNVTLTQAQIISVADLTQSQTLDNITLTQAHVLTVADVSQAQTLDNVTLTQANILSVADLSQDQTLDSVTLTIAGVLAINDITTGQTLDNVTLTQAGILAVNELSQGQTLDAVTLTQAYILAINDLTQNQTLDNVTLNVGAYTITPDDISHLQTLDGVTLTQYHVLSVDDLTQSQILDAVTLGGLVIGSLNGTLVVYALLDGELTVMPLLDGTVKTLH